MIKGLFDKGALPALERTVQFTEQRHRVLADNIANLSNPYYKGKDLDPASFQATLRNAVEDRRATETPSSGSLSPSNTDQVRFGRDGLDVEPTEVNETVMFHDQSNVDLERTMQRLAENTLSHNLSVELVRNQFQMMELAIRGRA